MSLFPSLAPQLAQQALAIVFVRSRRISNFIPNVTIEEHHTDELAITRHPVDRSGEITDHAYKEPPRLTVRCGYSNSPTLSVAGIASLITSLPGTLSNLFSGLGNPDYVSAVYQQFLALQEGRVPFSIVTGKRLYDNMLLERITTTTDERTENALILTLECRNVILVDTQVLTMPPASQQANPALTNPITLNGVKNAVNGTTPVTIPQ